MSTSFQHLKRWTGSLVVGVPLVFAPLVSVTRTAHAETNELLSDSGIQGPPYLEIVAAMGDLALRSSGWAHVVDYGQSAGGATLRLVKIQNPTHQARAGDGDRPAVLISGSTHGNEYLHIEDRLPGWFVDNRDSSPGVMKFLNAGGIIYIIPILNPDGYERRTRENADGVDLNRDFDLLPAHEQKFREPETRLLAQYLDGDIVASHARLKLTVDYHCCDGSLLFPWSYTEDPLREGRPRTTTTRNTTPYRSPTRATTGPRATSSRSTPCGGTTFLARWPSKRRAIRRRLRSGDPLAPVCRARVCQAGAGEREWERVPAEQPTHFLTAFAGGPRTRRTAGRGPESAAARVLHA
jgi:hypothetical protein